MTLVEQSRIRPTWAGRRTGPNALLLDTCRLLGDGRGQELRSVSDIRADLEETLGRGAGATLTAEFPIRISHDDPPEGPLALAIELGEEPILGLNGAPLCPVTDEWVMDPAIRKIPLPALNPGANTLETGGRYGVVTDFEIPWLLGEFVLTSPDSIAFTAQRDDGTVGIGSWPDLGLPFYAGTVVYRAEVDLPALEPGQRVTLDMPGLAGSAEVRVNGRIVDHVLWPPYSCELTASLTPGVTVVEVEVANTLRNLLGPHYNYGEKMRAGISIASYSGSADQRKQFMEYGLLEAPEIVISREAEA